MARQPISPPKAAAERRPSDDAEPPTQPIVVTRPVNDNLPGWFRTHMPRIAGGLAVVAAVALVAWLITALT